MSKKNFGSFSLEDLDELETEVDQAQATAEDAQATADDAQATAEATATELEQHAADTNAHEGGEAEEAAQVADGADTTAADIEAANDATAADAPEVETTTADVEKAVVEAEDGDEITEEAEEEVAAMDEAVERTDDVIEAVEEIEPENEDAPAEIDATVGLANESMKRLLGARFDKSLLAKLPANESYSLKSVRTRQMYKSLAIESLQESKDGFFTKMKNAIIKIWNWIKARLDKLVTWFRGSAKERAAILKRAQEAKITNRVVIDNATLAQYLTVNGEVEDTVAGLSMNLKVMGELLTSYYKRAVAVADGHAFTLGKGGDGADVLKGLFSILPASDNGTPLLGGWTHSVKAGEAKPDDINEVLEAISDISVTVERDTAPSKERVTSLNSADIANLFREVDKFEKEVIDSPEAKKARSIRADFISHLIAKHRSKDDSREDMERMFLRIASRLSALLTSPLAKLSSVANSSVSTINLFAKVSLRAGKGESVEEDLKATDASMPNVKPGKGTKPSMAERKANAEDAVFRDLSNEDHKDPTVEGGEDPLDLNPSDQPGDATLNQSSQPAAAAPGTQDAKMKESELELPEEPQITAAIEQYEEFTDHIEDGVEGLELTERTIAVAEGAQGKQGLDEAGAELMSIASEAIHKHWLGMEAVNLGLGVESFSRSAYKLKATGISVESWKEKAQEIGKKIVEMVKKLGRMIRYLWKQFKTFFKGLEGKYERINRRLATTKEATMKNGKGFETEKFAINGKAITPSVFSSAITSAAKIATDVAEDALDLAEIAADQVEGKASDAARKVQQFTIGSRLAKNSDVKTSKAEGKTTYTFNELPGNRVASFTRPDMTDGIELGFSASLGKGEGEVKKVKVRNLDKSESKQIMQAVRKGLDVIDQVGKDIETIAKQVEEIGKGLDPKKLEGDGVAKAARKAVGALGKAVMSDSKVAIQGIRLISEAGLDYVAKSIGMKGTEAQAEDQATAGAQRQLPAPSAA